MEQRIISIGTEFKIYWTSLIIVILLLSCNAGIKENNIEGTYLNAMDSLVENGQKAIYGVEGNLLDLKNYKNGVKDGWQLSFYSDGRINSISHFVDGKRHGQVILYNKDGNIYSKTKYVNGNIHGKWQMFNANGDLSFEGNYINGLKDGKFIYFDTLGNIKSLKIYERDTVVKSN